MSRVQDPFYKRISRIQRQHRKLAGGYALRVDSNNLIVPRPVYVTFSFPWRGLFLALMVALAFKAYVISAIDPQTYAAKLNALTTGHPIERVGAFVMQPDLATETLADLLRQMRG